MIISHDYIARFLATSIQPPKRKDEVTDTVFRSVIGNTGGHQRIVDVSRCSLLTTEALDDLKKCESLSYLDVSFTQFCAVETVVHSCLVLRSLNLAGCQCDLEALRWCTTLEWLNLRSTSIVNVDILKQMELLRSLDLGETAVECLEPLEPLIRLEELYLDNCKSLVKLTKFEMGDVIDSLPSLKLVNLGEIGYSDSWLDQLLSIVRDDVYIDMMSLRLKFVDMIVRNDYKNLRFFLQSGVNGRMRIGPWAENIALSAWKTRCKSGNLAAPFFVVSHPDEELRPVGLHLALYFNCQDALQVLLEMTDDDYMTKKVWLSDVIETNGILVINEKRVKKPELCCVETRYLPMVMNEKSVHRFSCGMIQQNEAHWKSKCSAIEERLKIILEGKWLTEAAALPSITTNVPEISEIVLEKEGSDAILDQSEGDQLGTSAERNSDDENSDNEERERNRNHNATVAAYPQQLVADVATLPLSRPDIGDNDEHDDDESSCLEQEKKKSVKKNMFGIAPKERRRWAWQDHPMVSKLVGQPWAIPPGCKISFGKDSSALSHSGSSSQLLKSLSRRTMVRSSSSRNQFSATSKKDEVRYLGKKSFWLESKRRHAQEVAEREGRLAAEMVEKRMDEQLKQFEQRKTVDLSELNKSEEDLLLRPVRSTYDLPFSPKEPSLYGLPRSPMKAPMSDRIREIQSVLRKNEEKDEHVGPATNIELDSTTVTSNQSTDIGF